MTQPQSESLQLAEALLDGLVAPRIAIEGYELARVGELYEARVLFGEGKMLEARSRLGYLEAATDVARWVVRGLASLGGNGGVTR